MRRSDLRAILPLIVAAAWLTVAPAMAGNDKTADDAPDTKATDIHGAPGNTPGFGGSSANPASASGIGKNGGDGIHGIDGGAPGHGGENTADDRPAGNMHGGLNDNTGYDK